MALYALGDLHLSLGEDKPMDVFAGWNDYVQRLEENWKRLVTDGDTVVIAGDIQIRGFVFFKQYLPPAEAEMPIFVRHTFTLRRCRC